MAPSATTESYSRATRNREATIQKRQIQEETFDLGQPARTIFSILDKYFMYNTCGANNNNKKNHKHYIDYICN